MSLGFVFLLLGGALLWLGIRQEQGLSSFLYLSAAAAFLGIALCYQMTWPGLLGKTRKGRLLPSSYLLLWPYHLLTRLSLLLRRALTREAPFDEIIPGLYLGGRLLPWEEARMKPLSIKSVLDLTAEFSETRRLRNVPAYLCIPILDHTAPSQAEMELGIAFIREHLPKGPVYVHCALGHGRSATVLVGYLLASGRAKGLREALAFVQSRRRGVRLTAEQLKSLETFSK